MTDGGGQVYGYPNLYVLDGACLPVATGVNPIGVDFGSDCLRMAQVQMGNGEPRIIAAASETLNIPQPNTPPVSSVTTRAMSGPRSERSSAAVI